MFINLIDNYLITSEKIINTGGKELILLKNNLVFGDGSHDTTKIMIELMNSCDFTNKICLDIGCGTGILSIIARKKGCNQNILLDKDTEACKIAEKNLKLNGIIDKVKILNQDFITYKDNKADIILANQTAINLLYYGNYFNNFIKKDAILIVSGFNSLYKEYVKSKFKSLGYEIKKEYKQDIWIGLVLKKI